MIDDATARLSYPDTWTLTPYGEPLSHTRTDQREESWQLNSHELTTQYTDWMGFQTDYEYDSLGDTTEIDYPDGGVVKYEYNDAFGEPTKMTDQDNNVTIYEYNNTGRPDGR